MFVTKSIAAATDVPARHGRGAGLPLLDAMVPALTAAAQTAASPRPFRGHLRAARHDHGAVDAGDRSAPLEFTPIMKPLGRRQGRMLVVSNLARPEAGFDTNHAGAPASWLTGVAPKRTDGPDFRLGVTVDQVIAGKIGQDTTFPSLEVATEDFTALLGSCAPGYSCAYANTLSWQAPTTPLPMEINPRVLFERMFGGGDTADQRLARMREDRSILDFVAEDVAALERGIGGAIAAARRVSRQRPRGRAADPARRDSRRRRRSRCPTRRSACRSRTRSTSA